MSQKTFYRYNPNTDQYERVFPSRSQRWRIIVGQFAGGITIGLLLFLGAYYLIDFPREKELRQQNEQLEQKLHQLSRRSDQALAVMEDIAQRDNNFYRVMMQAEPLSQGARYAGLERQRNLEALDSLTDSELVRNVTNKIDRLDYMIYNQIKSFDFLQRQAATLEQRANNIPAIQPVSSKSLRAMASGFGYRRDPIYGTTKFHEGMDFSAPVGTPVYATGDATVQSASWESGYGNMIVLNHGFGYTTRYAHLSNMVVRPGQSVKRGDLIGHVGNTGKSTGSHLHYEVRFRGAPQNPVHYYFMDLTPDQWDEMIRQADNAGHVMD